MIQPSLFIQNKLHKWNIEALEIVAFDLALVLSETGVSIGIWGIIFSFSRHMNDIFKRYTKIMTDFFSNWSQKFAIWKAYDEHWLR